MAQIYPFLPILSSGAIRGDLLECAAMTTDLPDVPFYIFDIDGTLTRYVDVDPSSFLHGNFLFPIVRDLMVERGADRAEAEAAILRETETNVYWDYADLVSAFGLSAPEAYRRFRAWHAAHIAPHEDAVALARELKRAGKRLFVVSNNPVTGCLLKLQAAGLADDTGSDVFSRILGTNVLRGCKCAPGVWRRALDRLAVDPALVCTVGDNPVEDAELPKRCGVGASFLFDRGRIERGIDGGAAAPPSSDE